MIDTTISDSWDRLERWLSRNGAADALLPPAPVSIIAAAESKLGAPLPSEYRLSLQRHDGESFEPEHFVLGGWLLLPLGDALRERELQLRIPQADWSASWLPVASNGAGDHYCLDLSAGSSILRVAHEYEEIPLLFVSFADLLKNAADEAEAGIYVMVEGRVEREDGHADTWARNWYHAQREPGGA